MLDTFRHRVREHRHARIINTVRLPKDSVILDCSCGNGSFLNRLHNEYPEARLFGVDVSKEGTQEAATRFPIAHFSTQQAEQLNFKPNTFDVVFSIMSLHHYQNPADFFSEIERVLKPGGVLYMADVQPKYEWTQKIQSRMGCIEPYHFEKYYLLSDIEAILQQTKLHVKSDISVATVLQRIRLLRIEKNIRT